MLDEFLTVACEHEKKASDYHSMVADMKRLPVEELYALAEGKSKLAFLCGDSEEWLEKYEGTPFHEQALQLEQAQLEHQIACEQRRLEEQSQEKDKAREEEYRQGDALRLKKRILDLELNKYRLEEATGGTEPETGETAEHEAAETSEQEAEEHEQEGDEGDEESEEEEEEEPKEASGAVLNASRKILGAQGLKTLSKAKSAVSSAGQASAKGFRRAAKKVKSGPMSLLQHIKNAAAEDMEEIPPEVLQRRAGLGGAGGAALGAGLGAALGPVALRRAGLLAIPAGAALGAGLGGAAGAGALGGPEAALGAGAAGAGGGALGAIPGGLAGLALGARAARRLPQGSQIPGFALAGGYGLLGAGAGAGLGGALGAGLGGRANVRRSLPPPEEEELVDNKEAAARCGVNPKKLSAMKKTALSTRTIQRVVREAGKKGKLTPKRVGQSFAKAELSQTHALGNIRKRIKAQNVKRRAKGQKPLGPPKMAPLTKGRKTFLDSVYRHAPVLSKKPSKQAVRSFFSNAEKYMGKHSSIDKEAIGFGKAMKGLFNAGRAGFGGAGVAGKAGLKGLTGASKNVGTYWSALARKSPGMAAATVAVPTAALAGGAGLMAGRASR